MGTEVMIVSPSTSWLSRLGLGGGSMPFPTQEELVARNKSAVANELKPGSVPVTLANVRP